MYGGSASDVVIPVMYQNVPVTQIWDNAFEDCNVTSVVIPEGVTKIGLAAFQKCKYLTSLNIPKSVTKIEDIAFNNCSGLTSISVAEGNPNYHSVDNCLIETASKTLILGCRNSVVPVDGSVTVIANCAFRSCGDLLSVVIPEGVTKIGWEAFA